MKKFLALTGLIVACSLPFAAQSLECSVKPKVTSIEAPHSYMFVGNSYTYYVNFQRFSTPYPEVA